MHITIRLIVQQVDDDDLREFPGPGRTRRLPWTVAKQIDHARVPPQLHVHMLQVQLHRGPSLQCSYGRCGLFLDDLHAVGRS